MRLGSAATLSWPVTSPTITLSLGLGNLNGPGIGIYGYQVEDQQARATYGSAGYALQTRILREPFWIFDCDLALSTPEFRRLHALWVGAQRSPGVLLSNSRQAHFEWGSGTRALASGAPAVSGTPAGYSQYFAQWRCQPVLPADWYRVIGADASGQPVWGARFQLVELAKVPL